MSESMTKAPTSDTMVVIPTYCERENIESIIPAVLEALPCDLMVVDDESPDGTGELAEKIFGADPRVSVLIRRGRPRGLGPAYVEGFLCALEAGYGFIFQMDADFSHQPQALPALRAAASDADLVIGSRYVPGGGSKDWGLLRRFTSRGGSWYARTVLGLSIRDVTAGFKCWRSEALAALDLGSVSSTGFAFQIEMSYRSSLRSQRIVEVPIRFVDRSRGESKMSVKILMEGLTTVWRLRFSGGR